MLPTWIVYYRKRRPRINAPLGERDYDKIEVGAIDRERAATSFNQRFRPQYQIVAIEVGSGTGFS